MESYHYGHGTRPIVNMFVPLNIPEFNIKQDMYMIDYYGNILNKNTNKILSQAVACSHGYGYRTVGLQLNDNSRRTFFIHILVAKTFIHKTEEDILLQRDTVNHMSGFVDDNCYTQLEWMTIKENTMHGIENNISEVHPIVKFATDSKWSQGEKTKGSKNGCSRLNEEQVHIICKSVQDGCNYKTAALNANLEGNANNLYLISHIIRGHRWKHISCLYNLNNN